MPDGCLSFGFLSTPGASAAELRTELLNADIPRTPDIVCLLAPSNNLTATPGIEAAGVAFDGLLRAARSRWPKVFVLDFPPRLASELAPQQFLREEFRRVAAKNDVKYCVTADRFPLDSRALWSRDGIHLSDDLGMPLLAKLLWHFSFQQLQSPLPVTPPPVSPPKSPPTVRPFATTVVVKGEVSRPRPLDPFKETVVGRRGKRSQPESWDAPEDWDQSSVRILPHEVCVPPLVLRECFVVLNPIRFSTDKLAAMDRIVPSNLDVPMGNRSKKRKVAHGTTAVVSKGKKARLEVGHFSVKYVLVFWLKHRNNYFLISPLTQEIVQHSLCRYCFANDLQLFSRHFKLQQGLPNRRSWYLPLDLCQKLLCQPLWRAASLCIQAR
ncbi:uncharacterized protein LOC115538678 [Gadus morhua]|uniref:uncharacterized protein LOC115538678 n=1 Tax=Gadus morhua TaxID=8049 RepID=UPI0011B693DC|nr:uncharacterized protein LOC115538678 [Gadus morhua]